jgi:signal transduction histidine kinase
MDFLAGGGEIGERMRAHDWSRTPIGAADRWSPSIRMMVSLLLANRFPMLLWWGPRYVQIYNDAYRPVLGTKHPAALGQPAAECWPEIWDIIGPLIDTPFNGGPSTWMEDIELEPIRHGYAEESHFTIAYSPVPDETAARGIGGVLASVHEITGKVIGERRVAALRALASRVAEAKTAAEACEMAATTLGAYDRDMPFVMLYLLAPGTRRFHLCGTAGVAPGGLVSPTSVEPDGNDGHVLAPLLREVLASEALQVVEALPQRWPFVPPGRWSDVPHTAVAVPIRSTFAHQLAGVLVAGVSPRQILDAQYSSFFELVAGQIATAVANARAYEAERQRAEALADLDRAKTAFFSNVSHEFRTPLTLLLAPIEQTLADAGTAPEIRDRLEVAHRNALRLQKLVNSLLDFSRIEAGRVEASYEPVDLAALTADLASTFRSAIERAGLELAVECEALPGPVYVDRDMWEKIVLNLLSNAFKFTLQGRITVRLREDGGQARLDVSDTGVGVPESELPRLFERFYRVESIQGRTHEGSGIGLALVQELVRLHGGKIEGSSELAQGSTFSVWLPLGAVHLPADRIRGARSLGSTAISAHTFVQEALRWLPDDRRDDEGGRTTRAVTDDQTAPDRRFAATFGARIVLADDNADMRAYLCELLAPYYSVVPTSDGAAALEAVRSKRPDLVLCDVMMPRLDGFGLLAALRADESLRGMPVILLSARAGEEARIEGLDAGADDYLVKPFSARELLARVGAMLERSATTGQLAQEREQLLGAERAARADAESAIRAKDEFLATLSHELRTPLSNIVSWAGVLQRKYTADDEQLNRGLRVIVDNAMAQSQIIADLVDISRIVAGKVVLELKPIDLADLATLTVNAQRPAADAKGITLDLELQQEGAAVVLADATRLQQVMWNLLANALKFTPTGGRIELLLRANGGREIEIEVRDTGEGIAPEVLPYVFDRFRQADSGAARRYGGLGLGLAIVKQLVELHGGEVSASSPGPGRGTSFVVRIPAYRPDVRSPLAIGAATDATQALEGQQLTGLCVLAVEDQRDMLEFLQRVLEEQGADVLTATSGPAALELLQAGNAGSVDVLICDIGMPKMDGYQLLNSVRAQLRLAPDVLPAVAVTAYAREEDRERSLAAGFQAHVTKPYQVAQLIAILRRLRQPAAVD